jgi:hypothetical protein
VSVADANIFGSHVGERRTEEFNGGRRRIVAEIAKIGPWAVSPN